MNISQFITQNMEQILVEWEAFAATFGAVVDKMSSHELRDHAKQILQFVAEDIQTVESAEQTQAKSQGLSSRPACDGSASSIHGRLRYASGFTLLQLIAEYRALRASVLKLWQRDGADQSAGSLRDIMRFNEAIDQSLQDAAIPKDALPALFTSLVQLPEQEGQVRPRSSLGLGLFIAKQIAVAHGGDIDVASDDVTGTVFTVGLPRHQANAA